VDIYEHVLEDPDGESGPIEPSLVLEFVEGPQLYEDGTPINFSEAYIEPTPLENGKTIPIIPLKAIFQKHPAPAEGKDPMQFVTGPYVDSSGTLLYDPYSKDKTEIVSKLYTRDGLVLQNMYTVDPRITSPGKDDFTLVKSADVQGEGEDEDEDGATGAETNANDEDVPEGSDKLYSDDTCDTEVPFSSVFPSTSSTRAPEYEQTPLYTYGDTGKCTMFRDPPVAPVGGSRKQRKQRQTKSRKRRNTKRKTRK
jgi:hypothetical protein